MAKPLQVGIIGASPNRGWAQISHVPAVQQLDGLELGAVVTRDQESADRAAREYGARAGYSGAEALFADPAIDIVTVAVNVPAHRDLVLGALAAGKHLFCEYPLGCDVAEAEMLDEAARKAGVHAAIGLQTRTNPAARRAKELLAGDAIGRILSARILSTAMAFGPKVEAAMEFGEKPENGVTLATIQAAHTLDLAVHLLGTVAEMSVLASKQFPTIEIEGKGEQPRTVPDHIAVAAKLESGAPLVVEVAGGRPPDQTPFRFEITGEAGTILLEGGAPRGFQSGVLTLSLNGDPQPLAPAIEPDTAVNVAGVYAMLRDDIRNGTTQAPGFGDAVQTQRLVASMLEAAKGGERVRFG